MKQNGTASRLWAFAKRYPLSLSCIALIWVLCLMPVPPSELDDVSQLDKVVHFVMYFGTCGIIWIEYARSHRQRQWLRALAGALLAPVLMSGLIELLQAYATDYRGGDWADFFVNTLGALAAAVAYWGWERMEGEGLRFKV